MLMTSLPYIKMKQATARHASTMHDTAELSKRRGANNDVDSGCLRTVARSNVVPVPNVDS